MIRQPGAAATAARLLGEMAGFSVLLFVTRFVLRGHLLPEMEQECHMGGIALDVLAHGVRFPLLVYAPNEYDNGTFFSGLLTALSFQLIGRNVLALKLVPHLVSAGAAVAALELLRDCLNEVRNEVGLTGRIARFAATATLVIAFAFAPRVVTLSSMYAVDDHAGGTAIDVILLALFARFFRSGSRSALRAAALWASAGFALYLNKGTLLVLPLLVAAQMAVRPRDRREIAGAVGGFAVGLLPELWVVVQRQAMGWAVMAGKAERGPHAFPDAFLATVLGLAERRPELLAAWALSVATGMTLFVRTLRRGRRPQEGADVSSDGTVPVALGMVLGVVFLHLLALTVMAQGGLDAYAVYSYPALVVLLALTVAWTCTQVAGRWGARGAAWSAVAAIALTSVLYRPDAIAWGTETVSMLWRNRAGAACSWRLAEGFEREQQYGLASRGETREQHAIDRCRSLAEKDQVLDCIGGIARELNWRQSGSVAGEPPASLSVEERRAYAYLYGTHRKGNASACREFRDAALVDACASATRLECLVFGDAITRFMSGRSIGRPRCAIGEPPMGGYWAAMRSELLGRQTGPGPESDANASVDADLEGCRAVFQACY